MLFTGEYEHTIDSKQRVAIPSEIRTRLMSCRGSASNGVPSGSSAESVVEAESPAGEALYLAPGPNGNLWLWPERTFERMAGALEESLLPGDEMMEFEELFFSQSTRLEMDKAGRIRLPERMMRLASLTNAVIILGVKDHLELREPASWKEQREQKLARQREIMRLAREAGMTRASRAGREDGA